MERARAIADAHYRAGPAAVKALAFDFFRALDSDGDGQVSLQEFLALMRHEGHTRLANPYFFRELDRDGNGYLDFWEVLTLYYIIKSGRPICQCCGVLVLETYFSCVECFDSSDGSHSLCLHCYRSNRSHHNHDGRQQFLDTFTLLQTKRRPRPPLHHHNHNHNLHLHQGRPWEEASCWSSTTTPHQAQAQAQAQAQGQAAIVPAATGGSGMSGWKAALVALEIGLGIGSISTTLCTIL